MTIIEAIKQAKVSKHYSFYIGGNKKMRDLAFWELINIIKGKL